jgi:hypothetical protein
MGVLKASDLLFGVVGGGVSACVVFIPSASPRSAIGFRICELPQYRPPTAAKHDRG